MIQFPIDVSQEALVGRLTELLVQEPFSPLWSDRIVKRRMEELVEEMVREVGGLRINNDN